MVDSRQKGSRAESALVKLLNADTDLNWKRVPGSGALHQDHMLKGDVYVPGEHNNYCLEVKHYKDCQLTSKILTDKNPMLFQWWEQAVRQGLQTNKQPILFFKHDRSKWFVMFDIEENVTYNDCPNIVVGFLETAIITYDNFIKESHIKWIK